MVVKRLQTFLMNLRHDTSVYIASLVVQAKAAAALRGAFLAQVLGMMLNNAAVIVAWSFFFDKFGTVHGWGFHEFIAMQAVSMFVYGAILFASTGLMDIPRHVDTGSFDTFLTKPVSVLGQVGSSNIDISTVGDMLLGLVLVGWYIGITGVGLVALLLFVASLIVAFVVFWCAVMLFPYILAFYVFDSERLSRYFGVMFLDAMNFPGGLLTGGLRGFFLIAIPSLLVSVVPVDVLKGLRWQWVGYGAIIALVWLIGTLWLFKQALKRYESANLISAR
jgi:ABC-2 type transport system permease protein